jgi:transglutaminase-like putative cysteine protease
MRSPTAARGRRAAAALACAALLGALCGAAGAAEHPAEHPTGAQEGADAQARPSPRRPGQIRVFRITYSAQMDVPADAGNALLYLPLPPTAGHQRVASPRIECNGAYEVVTDPKFGNELVAATGQAGRPLTVSISAVVSRNAFRVLEHPGWTPPQQEAGSVLDAFLGPNQLVPLGGKVAAEAEKAIEPGMTDEQKARAMYDYLASTMTYDKSVPGYGRGDAVRACDVRKGNCTDFHSLFIGMARSQGIPARFHIGFPLPPDEESGQVAGYHCWAEFHLDEVGWVPVDISEAARDPSRHEELYGGLDENRVRFTCGRDIPIPGSGLGPQNYIIYPIGVVDGQVQDDVAWEFRFEDISRPAALHPGRPDVPRMPPEGE